MKKSIPSSVTAAEQSPAPKLSFLFHSGRPWIMGVLNATPDSFYAGSRTLHVESAVRLAEEMVREGADVLDIGGESTRPGAADVPASEEAQRVLPVIDALHSRWPDLPLSIDTQKADIARQALAHGVTLINDISALRHDPEMADVAAQSEGPVVLMHIQGTPQTMQSRPFYADVVDEVKRFFEERLAFAVRQHIREERVILDPGIGFGKTIRHNMTLLKHLADFLPLGRPLLVGVSRKSFIGRLLARSPGPSPDPPLNLGGPAEASVAGRGEGEMSPAPSSGDRARHNPLSAPSPGLLREGGQGPDEGILPPEERLEGSLAAALWAVQQGAVGLRVHDVGPTKRALELWEGLQNTP